MDEVSKKMLSMIKEYLKDSTLEAAEKASMERLGRVDGNFCLGWVAGGVKQALKQLDDLNNWMKKDDQF